MNFQSIVSLFSSTQSSDHSCLLWVGRLFSYEHESSLTPLYALVHFDVLDALVLS